LRRVGHATFAAEVVEAKGWSIGRTLGGWESFDPAKRLGQTPGSSISRGSCELSCDDFL